MSGIGFWELVVLFLIGLLVLGPERLPRVANQLGGWLGQARRMTRVMKRQLEDELDFEQDFGLKTPRKKKPAPDVSKPEYVQDKNVGEDEAVEHDDTFSPDHDEETVGSGVGDDRDYIDDDELEPLGKTDEVVTDEVVTDEVVADEVVADEVVADEATKKQSA